MFGHDEITKQDQSSLIVVDVGRTAVLGKLTLNQWNLAFKFMI